MADSTLNRFIASGTTTQRTAFTPSPPTPASGPSFGELWWDTTLQALYAWDSGSASWKAATAAGTGTVTHTAGALTTGRAVIGNGGADIAVGIPPGTDGASLVLLDSQTASSSSFIEVTAFSSTYMNYFVTFENVVPATNAANLLMTWSDAGGYFSTNYKYAQVFRGGSSALGSAGSTSASSVQIWGNASNANPVQGHGYLLGTQQTSGLVTVDISLTGIGNGGDFFWQNTGGMHALTAAVTKMKWAMSAGNITSGIFRLYGIAKA